MIGPNVFGHSDEEERKSTIETQDDKYNHAMDIPEANDGESIVMG